MPTLKSTENQNTREPGLLTRFVSKIRDRFLDLGFLLLLILITLIVVLIRNRTALFPYEDAAMLLRYSENLANGHGIVWNSGESPVDGATDFLLMVVIAAISKLGLSIDNSVNIVTISSHLLLTGIVFLSARKLYNSSIIFSLFLSFYLALGPGLYFIKTYFGTSFFALWATITWLFAIMIINREGFSAKLAVLFSFSGLITGLIRPEGVILNLLMLGAIIYFKGIKASLKLVINFLIVYGILGGTYFIWHWIYFGFPLPNPFYVKGGGLLQINSLNASITNVLNQLIPFILILVFSIFKQPSRKLLIFLLIPVVGFTLIWILLSDAMNWGGRYQYAILPIFLIMLPAFLPNLQEINTIFKTKFDKIIQTGFLVLFFGCILIYQRSVTNSLSLIPQDLNYYVATNLSEFKNRNYTIATTEAGLVPYYSKWRAIDTYGLNDKWIAHNGIVSDAYLDIYKPEIVMFHTDSSPLVDYKFNPNTFNQHNWGIMVDNLKNYVEKNHYILAAVFGTSINDSYYYYVKEGLVDGDNLIRAIQNVPFHRFK